MKACVFVGPTVRPEELAAAGDIALLPPVAQGDVYRIAQEGPIAIGIVDGYFEGVLSVWHKEILWAMSEGIHVFGSASMGALRAAELHPFGMRGIGRIFECYRDGELEDDDEVAVIHGPRETGYLALSEAMVNVRETLAGAEHCGIIAGATRAALVGIAKELFYHDRTFDRILELGAEGSMPSGEIAALRAWLPQGRVDQKRADALAMLEAMRALLAQAPGPMQVDFVLEWTEVWDEATTAAAASRQPGDGSAAWLPDDRVLEELRLEAGTYLAVRDRALLRVLAGREAERRRQTADAGARQETLARLRARHGLFTRADLDRWLEANAIDRRRLERIVDEEVQLEAVRALAAAALRITCSTSYACATSSPASPSAPGASGHSLRSWASTIRVRTRRSWRRRLPCAPGISSSAWASRCRTTSTRPRASSASRTGSISIAPCGGNGYTSGGPRAVFERSSVAGRADHFRRTRGPCRSS